MGSPERFVLASKIMTEEMGWNISLHSKGCHRSVEILEAVVTTLSMEFIDGIVYSFKSVH